jgi:hypothetical protein
MPYVTKASRDCYDPHINQILKIWDSIGGKLAITSDVAGDFTYIIYRLLKFFSGSFWMRALGIGCLVCAILEIYRRDHGLYEDKKINENGDVK